MFLALTGINIKVFTAHSTRRSSTSKLNNIGLSVKDIMKTAGWTNESTFRKFYKFPVTKNVGEELLNAIKVRYDLITVMLLICYTSDYYIIWKYTWMDYIPFTKFFLKL